MGYCGVDQLPQIFAVDCEGAFKAGAQLDGKFRCKPCTEVKQIRAKNINQIMKRKLDQTMLIESIVFKSFVTDFEIGRLHDYVRNADSRLSEKGQILKRKADALLWHNKHIRKLAEKHPDDKFKATLCRDDGAIGADSLISKFAKLYANHRGFKDALIVCLLEAVIAKVEGNTNLALAPMAANFFAALHSTSPKGFDIVSANLWGPLKRAIQVWNAKGRNPEPFICFNENSIQSRLGEIMHTIGSDIKNPTFSISIDATKVPPVKQLSPSYSAIIGGCSPKHFLNIGDSMTADEASKILADHSVVKPAYEVKVAVLTFQKVPKGVSPTFVLCGLPQTTNEVNAFNDTVVASCVKFCADKRSAKLLSCAVDGVSSDSAFVRKSIIKFLSGEAYHVAQTDTNHNNKSLKYQILVGGSCCASVGNYIVDQGLLTVCGIPVELYS